MKPVFQRPKSMTSARMHYCPGCGHSIVHRLVAEVIDELDIQEKVIGIAPVGCAVLAYDYWDFDVSEAAHGRPPAVATGIKRVHPDKLVFTYQGDGDLASIGAAEILHAANRSENISIIFINNTVYGMTGGQMAPTTLLGQITTTTPDGRTTAFAGYPMKMSEILAAVDGAKYLERTAVDTPANIMKTKAAIKKAFKAQMDNKGFTMVEVLSMCPTNWRMTPIVSAHHISKELVKVFPLGVIKDEL